MKPKILKIGICEYGTKLAPNGWEVSGWIIEDVPMPYLDKQGLQFGWTLEKLREISRIGKIPE